MSTEMIKMSTEMIKMSTEIKIYKCENKKCKQKCEIKFENAEYKYITLPLHTKCLLFKSMKDMSAKFVKWQQIEPKIYNF